jgi:hypothetical protein
LRTLRLTTIPLAVAALGLAACGGDDSAYLADADAICVEGAQEITDQQLALERPPATANEIAAALEQGNPVTEAVQTELAAVEVPAKEQADWEAWLAQRQLRLDEREDAIGLVDDQRAFIAATAEISELTVESDAAAADLGLSACANRLGAESTDQVRDAEEELAASADPEQICNEIYLPQYIELLYNGDLQKCVDDEVNASEREIDIETVSGVDGVRATVNLEVSLGGPEAAGQREEHTWFYVDGAWRLYSSMLL